MGKTKLVFDFKEGDIKLTSIEVLEKLGLKIGDEITLGDLDRKIKKEVENDTIPTALDVFGISEILELGKFIYYFSEKDEVIEYINFEVIKNTGNENSVIRILK